MRLAFDHVNIEAGRGSIARPVRALRPDEVIARTRENMIRCGVSAGGSRCGVGIGFRCHWPAAVAKSQVSSPSVVLKTRTLNVTFAPGRTSVAGAQVAWIGMGICSGCAASTISTVAKSYASWPCASVIFKISL